LAAGAARRRAADAGDPEPGGELQVIGKLMTVHGCDENSVYRRVDRSGPSNGTRSPTGGHDCLVHLKAATTNVVFVQERTWRVSAIRRSMRSRISAATCDFGNSGSDSVVSAPTIVTALVSTSKPESVRDTSLATSRS